MMLRVVNDSVLGQFLTVLGFERSASPGFGAVAVEPLGQPGVARSLATSGTSASVALTATVRRVSLYAKGADIRYRVGVGAQTAVAADHFIASGERLDIMVPPGAVIAAIQDTAAGVLCISELG